MAIPTPEEAFANMEKVGSERVLEGITRRAAELNAAVQWSTAKTVSASTLMLQDSMHRTTGVITKSIDGLVSAQDRVIEAQKSIATETSNASASLRTSIDALKTATESANKDAETWSRRMMWMTAALIFAAFVQAFGAAVQGWAAWNQKPAVIVVPATNTTPSVP